MKTPRIANAIGQIDDDLVAGAAKCKTKNKKHWLKWGSLAACFAVLVIAGAAILPSLFRENVTPEGTDGRYKAFLSEPANLQLYGHGSIRLYMKNIGMSKLTVLSIMEKAVRYQKHGLARVLATTLWLDMMKSIMEKIFCRV